MVLTFKITKKLNNQQEAAFHLYLFAHLSSDTYSLKDII